MPLIPFGEYLPDLPAYQNPGATVAKNVLPLTKKSYGPVQALTPVTSALPARCQGAFGAKDYFNTGYVFAGTGTKLYKWGKAYGDLFFVQDFFVSNFFLTDYQITDSWVDISNPSPYSVGDDKSWEFVQYGNYIIACAPGNNIQVFVLGTSTTFNDLSFTAPQARFAAVIRDFVMFANLIDSSGAAPNKVRWPAIDDPTNFPEVGTSDAITVQSDEQILPEGGEITGIIGATGGADGAVFLDEAIYRVTYIGSPAIFQFDKVEKEKGTRIPGSIVNIGIMAFYIGIDGFYVFDGSQSVPIGSEKVDKTFYADFDQSYFYRVVSAADIKNKQVFWAYPGAGHVDGIPNKIIVYNWALQRWSLIETTIECFFKYYTTGYTLEDLDQFGTVDSIEQSFDDAFWSGGSILLSAFNDAHELSSFTGSPLSATIETGEFDTGDGQRVFVSGIRPVIDGLGASVAIGLREMQGNSVSYKPATTQGVDGMCPQRVSTRYARAKLTMPEGVSWTHAQGIEPVVQPDGER